VHPTIQRLSHKIGRVFFVFRKKNKKIEKTGSIWSPEAPKREQLALLVTSAPRKRLHIE
jgi:hypothetical protein